MSAQRKNQRGKNEQRQYWSRHRTKNGSNKFTELSIVSSKQFGRGLVIDTKDYKFENFNFHADE